LHGFVKRLGQTIFLPKVHWWLPLSQVAALFDGQVPNAAAPKRATTTEPMELYSNA
jgi:hypothetical protein